MDPLAPGVVGVGGRDECDFLGENSTRFAWGKVPDASQLQDVRLIYLLPTPAQTRKPVLPEFVSQLPEFVSQLPEAWLLAMPAPFLNGLRLEQLPPLLRTLVIDMDARFIPADSPRWPDELVLKDLRGLMFRGGDTVSANWSRMGIEPFHVPGLEFLHCQIDKQCEVLAALETFQGLVHLELTGVADHNIFESISGRLEVLSINNSGKAFPVANISRLLALKTVVLNGVKAPVDCRIFKDLPGLVELEVLNSGKIEHPEALLECAGLRSISFRNCKSPFKGDLKRAMEEHGYERLEIRFA